MIITKYGVECLYINKQNNFTFKNWLNESGFCDQDNAKLFIKKDDAVRFGSSMIKKLSALGYYTLKSIFITEIQINFYGRSEEIEISNEVNLNRQINIVCDTIYGQKYIALYDENKHFRFVDNEIIAYNFKSVDDARNFYNENINAISDRFMKSEMFSFPRIIATEKETYPLLNGDYKDE